MVEDRSSAPVGPKIDREIAGPAGPGGVFQPLIRMLRRKEKAVARYQGRKKRRFHGVSAKASLPPGTMVFVGERKMEAVRFDIIHYTETGLEELRDASVDQCAAFARAPGVTWINVQGIHDVGLIEALGKRLGLHPLTMEDIVNTTQRTKTEEFPGYLYVVLKTITANKTGNALEAENVSLVIGENYIVSFQEKEGEVFEALRSRILSDKARIRSMSADYLAYALMDAVIDQYFFAIERTGDRIEEIEDRIMIGPQPEGIQEIHRLKREILTLRKAVWPLREEIGALERGETPLIHPETRVFLRDLYDHTIQAIDVVETLREILSGVQDIYLSAISNRMNRVMEVLTTVATIFIPLTFIAGVYGMNFEYMPELEWRLGYFVVWGVMIAVGAGMTLYFRKKRWM